MTARMPGRPSLLVTLFGRVAALLVLVIGVIGALAFWTAREQIGRRYDAELITAANVLHALMGEELQRMQHPLAEPLEMDDMALLSAEDRNAFNAYAKARMFRIWRHGALALGSDTGPPLPPPVAADAGFRNLSEHGVTWRVYRLPVRDTDIVIDVGEEVATRAALVRMFALELVFPLLLVIPATGVLMWLSLADGLAALRVLGSELQRRTLQDLSKIDPQRWPRDLVPLIRTTNQLFQRLSSAYQQERRFVDHAAHQLRTPIATIKLQTQLIAREPDEAERRKLVSELEASAKRAAELNDRLLTLARLEAEIGTAGASDLDPETTAVLADLAPFAQSRGVTLAYEGEPAPVRGEATLLRLIASNLIDNAIRHAPEGSEVEVCVTVDPAAARLSVLDCGPGIPLADREYVFERFYRGPGEAPDGTGLGLSIVAEAVRVLGGTIALIDRPDGRSGLCACVTIPRSENSAG